MFLEKTVFRIRQKGVPPLLLPTSVLQIQFASQMWATRPHLGSIFEKLLHRKTFQLPAARILLRFPVLDSLLFMMNVSGSATASANVDIASAFPEPSESQTTAVLHSAPANTKMFLPVLRPAVSHAP